MNYIVVFRSLTFAQKAARILENSGIAAFIIKVPERLANRGCSYGVRISELNLVDAMVVLRSNGIQPVKVFVKFRNGTYSEVENDLS